MEREGQVILDLTQSNPTVCGLLESEKDLLSAFNDSDNLVYEPSAKGMDLARRALSEYYARQGIRIDPEHIILTASTSEAYAFLFRLLADPGDGIAFPQPSYPLFDFLAGLNDVRIDNYPLHFAGNWSIDISALQRMKDKKLRALTLVNPNNPTGSYVKTSELKAINAWCAARGMTLISDEVFQEFVIDGHPERVSLAGNREVLTFALGGLSKTLGLPQMKLSWILVSGPDELVDLALARLEVIADTYLSVNTPVQRALPHWLALQPRIHERIRHRLVDNYTTLKNIFGKIPSVDCLPAEGGWYAVVRLPGNLDEEEWIMTWLKEDRVFVHPGYFFDFAEAPFAVVSLLPSVKEFREGVQRMAQRITVLTERV